MSNQLPSGFIALTDLGDDMENGLHDHGDEVKVKQWTEAAIAALLAEARAKKKAHDDALGAENDTTGARKVANSNAKGFIATAQRMLTDDFGTTPNRAWEDAGWPSGTIASPTAIGERKKLLDKLVPWLGAHADKEVPNKQFTFAKGTELLKALSIPLQNLPSKVGDRVKAAAADVAAEKALRNGMSGLMEELGRLLADDSADWYYFGLVPPANPAPPAPAEHLEIHQAGPTTAVAGCDHSPRGQKYLFAVQVVGRDAQPVEQPARLEPQITLEDLPAGSTVKISVVVSNAAGKSAPSAVAELKLS